MLNFNLCGNKKGQVGETLTWVVATIIIVFLLLSAIYVSSLIGKSKNLDVEGIGNYEESDWVLYKTELALEINSANKEKILTWVEESSLGGANEK